MHNSRQKLLLRLLGLSVMTFAAGTTSVLAQQSDEEPIARPDYQVELIVFEYINPSATEEDWRGPTPAAEPDEIAEAPPSITPAPLEFSRVETEDFQLSEIAGRMRGSRDFRVVYHAAWVQPGYSKEEAPWLILGRVGRVPAKLRGRAKNALIPFPAYGIGPRSSSHTKCGLPATERTLLLAGESAHAQWRPALFRPPEVWRAGSNRSG